MYAPVTCIWPKTICHAIVNKVARKEPAQEAKRETCGVPPRPMFDNGSARTKDGDRVTCYCIVSISSLKYVPEQLDMMVNMDSIVSCVL